MRYGNYQAAYDKYEGIYGYRRITIYLNNMKQSQVNYKCVYRLMKHMELKVVIRRRRYESFDHSEEDIRL